MTENKGSTKPIKILTCKQVAEIIQAKTSTIYSWAEQGIIPCYKINGLLRFEEDDILQWIRNYKNTGRCYNSNVQTRSPRKGGGI